MAKGVKFKIKLHDPKTASRQQLLKQVRDITAYFVPVAKDFEERILTIYDHTNLVNELVAASKAHRDAWKKSETKSWAVHGNRCTELIKEIEDDILKMLESLDTLIKEEKLSLKLLNLDKVDLLQLRKYDIEEYGVEEHEYKRLFGVAKEKLAQRKKNIKEEIEYEAKLMAIHSKIADIIQKQHPLILRLKYYISEERKAFAGLIFREGVQQTKPLVRVRNETYLIELVQRINAILIQEKKQFYDPFNDLARQEITPVDRLCQMVAGEPQIDLDDINRMKKTFTEPDEVQMMVGVVKGNPGAFTPEAGKYVLDRLWFDSKKSMKDIKRKATHDLMMNIKNRISFDGDIKDVVKEKKNFSLIIIDIDHFKQFNDSYGHDIGDKVLIEVAAVLKNVLKRTLDEVYRIGGEEIAVILPETNLEGAGITSEKMRKAIEEYRLTDYDDNVIRSVTISVGVVSLEDYSILGSLDIDSNQLIKMVIKQADNNLYSAKNGGRNRVVESFFTPTKQ